VNTELNTLLVTLYVHLDDRILPAIGFSRDRSPGRKPALNDVELLCLVAQHLCERRVQWAPSTISVPPCTAPAPAAQPLLVRARGPVEQTRVAVEQPALVPLGQRGAADAAFVGDVRVWAASVDAFAETGCR
jgi:hypothetical protein